MVSRRSLLVLLGGLAATPFVGAGQSGPLTALEVERTERLLESRIACRGCHVIAGRGGAIGPSLDGIADRADLDRVLAVVRDPAAAIPGTIMPHQPMAERDARLLARYIHGQPASSGAPAPQAPPTLPPGAEEDGAALYARHCAACHGETGGGDGWNAASLPVAPTRHGDAALMSERPDDTLYDGIAGGGWVLDRSARMPAFGSMLSDAQIRALVGHIRTLCDCTQPAWAGPGSDR